MHWVIVVIVIIQALIAAIFGSFTGELAGKCHSGEIKNFKEWKAWVLEIIFVITLFTASYIGWDERKNRTYDTKHYVIETVSTTIEADSTEYTTFKIVKR